MGKNKNISNKTGNNGNSKRLNISTARKKPMTNFVCSIDPSIIVSTNSEQFEEAVANCPSDLPDNIVSSVNWVISKVINKIDAGNDEFFESIYNIIIVEDKFEGDFKEKLEDIMLVRNYVLDIADDLNNKFVKFYCNGDAATNVKRIAVYAITSEVIRRALKIKPSERNVSAASSSTETETINVRKLNDLIDHLRTRVLGDLSKSLQPLGITTKDIDVNTDIARLTTILDIKDINHMSVTDIEEKLDTEITTLVDKYITTAVKNYKPVTTLVVSPKSTPVKQQPILNKPVDVAASSNQSVRNRIIKVIRRLFKNSAFIKMLGLTDYIRDRIKNRLECAVGDVKEKDIENIMIDSRIIQDFIIRSQIDNLLTAEESKAMMTTINEYKELLVILIVSELSMEGFKIKIPDVTSTSTASPVTPTSTSTSTASPVTPTSTPTSTASPVTPTSTPTSTASSCDDMFECLHNSLSRKHKKHFILPV